MSQQKLPGQSDLIKFTFTVPIDSVKKSQSTELNPHEPWMKYNHDDENTCCLISL